MEPLAYAIVLLSVVCMKCQDLPRNVVVMAGSATMLDCTCTNCKPYRWYRYLPSSPSDDKVIFMGSRMADDVDRRFGVYKVPGKYPFERLDLFIANVQVNDSGTYKCLQQSSTANCAELIVLGSEPVCEIPPSKEEESAEKGGTTELRCNITVTSNGRPEVLCLNIGKGTQAETNCSDSSRDAWSEFTCTAEIPVGSLGELTCVVRINHKPLRQFMTCTHAANKPDYSYSWSWRPMSDDVRQIVTIGESKVLPETKNCVPMRLLLLVGSPIVGAFFIIFIAVSVFLLSRLRQMKGDNRYQTKLCKTSIETPSPVYTGLTVQTYEEIPEGGYISADPEFAVAPYVTSRPARNAAHSGTTPRDL